MRLALIITTYNRKDALRLVLAGALRQTRLADEIIVADDGSTDGTNEEVEALARSSPVPIIHCWQAHQGFRAAAGRNRAMARTASDYLVFIDGDIIPQRHFIEDHLAAAQKGVFVQGCRVLLGAQKTAELLRSGGISDISLFSAGIENRKNLIRSRLLSWLFSRPSTGLSGIRTCNFAFWREDAVAVNGFNEEFVGWGREDSEFAARLLHNGISRKDLRFSALAYHLHHPPSPRETLAQNDLLLEKTITQGLTWCEKGLKQRLSLLS